MAKFASGKNRYLLQLQQLEQQYEQSRKRKAKATKREKYEVTIYRKTKLEKRATKWPENLHSRTKIVKDVIQVPNNEKTPDAKMWQTWDLHFDALISNQLNYIETKI